MGEGTVGPGGRFTVGALPSGRLTVSADAAQARATAEVELEEGGVATVALRLGDGTLAGQVVGRRGEPVAGALVVARPAVGAGEAGERSALSGSDGAFTLSGLSGERFDVAATKDEGSAGGPGAGRRPPATYGCCRSPPEGSPARWWAPGGMLVGLDFYVCRRARAARPGPADGQQAVDGRGEFHLQLAPGRYRLRASAPGYAEGHVDGIEVVAGAETSGVRLELRPAGTIEGVVLEAETAAPLQGVHLATDRGHAWGVGRQTPLGGSAAISGPDGHFVLRDVALGEPGRCTPAPRATHPS